MNRKIEENKEENKNENLEPSRTCSEIVFPEIIEKIVSNKQLE